MKIRTATIDDALKIHEMHGDAVRMTCKDFYTKKQIESWLMGRNAEGYHDAISKGEMYVAENEGNVVGFGHAVPGEIAAIYVDPIFQGKGVGKLLLEYGLGIAKKGNLLVKVDSTINAEGFYARNGFLKVEEGVVTRNGVEIPIIIMENSR